ncbi:MAG: hypothetical protein JRH20_21130, partial [Deltaproteobacteria bacterium]|nr:hypothetical protein [Deltaproteobacteria bacterium]
LTSAGDTDVVVASYDSSGAHRWSKRVGGAAWERGKSIVVDASGNVSITGQFYGSTDFGGGSMTSIGESDIFLANYDSSGAHRWSKRFGATSWDSGWGVAVDGSGNIALTGSYRDNVDFGGKALTGVRVGDIFVASYDVNGVHRWSQGFGGQDSDIGTAVAVDSAGDVIVTGQFGDTVDFGGGALTCSGFAEDIFLVKLSAKP